MATAYTQDRDAEPAREADKRRAESNSAGNSPDAQVLYLQGTAGNAAVSQLLASRGRPGSPPALRPARPAARPRVIQRQAGAESSHAGPRSQPRPHDGGGAASPGAVTVEIGGFGTSQVAPAGGATAVGPVVEALRRRQPDSWRDIAIIGHASAEEEQLHPRLGQERADNIRQLLELMIGRHQGYVDLVHHARLSSSTDSAGGTVTVICNMTSAALVDFRPAISPQHRGPQADRTREDERSVDSSLIAAAQLRPRGGRGDGSSEHSERPIHLVFGSEISARLITTNSDGHRHVERSLTQDDYVAVRFEVKRVGPAEDSAEVELRIDPRDGSISAVDITNDFELSRSLRDFFGADWNSPVLRNIRLAVFEAFHVEYAAALPPKLEAETGARLTVPFSCNCSLVAEVSSRRSVDLATGVQELGQAATVMWQVEF